MNRPGGFQGGDVPCAEMPVTDVLNQAVGPMESETATDGNCGTGIGTRNAGTERVATSHGEALGVEAGQLEERRSENGAAGKYRALDLLLVVLRRGSLIARATALTAVLAAAGVWLLPNRYTAVTNIMPPQQSPSLASAMIGQLGALGPMAAMAQKDLGLKNPNDLYVGMLHSRSVEDALIGRFDLRQVYRDRRMSDARRDLEGASSVVLGKEGLVSISVEDKNPGRAAEMANAYVSELRRLTQDLAVTEAGQRRLFFERQLTAARDSLAAAEQELKATEQKTGLIQFDGQAKAIIEAVVKLRASIAAKETELHAMRLFSTEQNPDLRLGEQQLAGMRAQLTKLEKQTHTADENGAKGASGAANNAPNTSPNQPHGENESTANLAVPAGNVPEAGLQYVRKLREVKYAETMFELLAKQYEAARLDEAKTGAVIQVLDPAVIPDRKSSPPRTLLVALSTLLAFLVSTAYVVAAETIGRLRQDPALEARLEELKQAAVELAPVSVVAPVVVPVVARVFSRFFCRTDVRTRPGRFREGRASAGQPRFVGEDYTEVEAAVEAAREAVYPALDDTAREAASEA